MWARWVSWMDRREAATSLALTRIVVGLAIVVHLARLMWTGADTWVWLDEANGGLRDVTLGPLAATLENLRIVEAIALLGGTMVAVGAFTRGGVFLTWGAFGLLADTNGHAGGSYDELIKDVLFLLFWSGCGRALSVDATWRGRTGLVAAWPRYLMVVQVVVVYASTGFQKVSDSWVPGGHADALWYILQQPTWQRIDMRWLAPAYPVTQLATLATWAFEVTAPSLLLALWYRETRTRPGRLRAWANRLDARTLWLLAGVGMHIGIESAMEVGPFSIVAVAMYACAVHPDEWARLVRRARAAPAERITPRRSA